MGGEINGRHIDSGIPYKNPEFNQFKSILHNYKELLKSILHITGRPMEQGIVCHCQILSKWVFKGILSKVSNFCLTYLLRVHWLVYFK